MSDPVRNSDITLKAWLDGLQTLLKTQPEVWVRCELHALVPGAKFVRMEFIEHDAQGRQVARAQGGCFPATFEAIQRSFAAAGLTLTAGTRVLVRLRADLQPAYGFQVQVTDIDPSFTLGDLKTRMGAIRTRLAAEGHWDRNRSLPMPADFERVAVIAPPGAAGLGDFRASADVLESAGLTTFGYHEAAFQTADAPKAIIAALRQTFLDARAGNICAVALVRGGGAASDLAWLADYDLTRALCLMPVPVMTGIGHQKDRTMLDEVACIPCDTPSKVAEHIRTTVCNAAMSADRAYRDIVHQTSATAGRCSTDIATVRTRMLVDIGETARLSDAAVRATVDACSRALAASSELAARSIEATGRSIAINAQQTHAGAAQGLTAIRARILSDAATKLRRGETAVAQTTGAVAAAPHQALANIAGNVGKLTRYVQAATTENLRASSEASVALASEISGLPATNLSLAEHSTQRVTGTIRSLAAGELAMAENGTRRALAAARSAPAAQMAQFGHMLGVVTAKIAASAKDAAVSAEWQTGTVRREIMDHADGNIDTAAARLTEAGRVVLDSAALTLDRAEHGINAARTVASALDPRTVVAAGYAILRDMGGRPLTHAMDAAAATMLTADLRDGSVRLRPGTNDEGAVL